jgi:ribonuclease P protein subunit RPR2
VKKKIQKKPAEHTIVAEKRIAELFRQAQQVFSSNPELSNRYVEIARKMSMKYKVKIPKDLKRRFCKNCHHFLQPSVNCRVRIANKRVTYYCFNCKKFMRFPYKK